MSKNEPMTDAERHRQAAAATEVHSKSRHHHPQHDSSGGDAYGSSVSQGNDRLEQNEATFFVRHRSKLAAGLMVVLATMFFLLILGFVRI